MNIVESENYLLYNDTHRYIRNEILPLYQVCVKCHTKLVLDHVSDLHYSAYNPTHHRQYTNTLTAKAGGERSSHEDIMERYLYRRRQLNAVSAGVVMKDIVFTCMVCSFTQPAILVGGFPDPVKDFYKTEQEKTLDEAATILNVPNGTELVRRARIVGWAGFIMGVILFMAILGWLVT